jgi:hypothetical protein
MALGRIKELELGEEQIPLDEELDIDQVAEIETRLLTRATEIRELKAQNPDPKMQRGQHPKQHGCLWAEFIVESNLPECIKVGLFKEAKLFPAWIRFSNARTQDDSKPGAHGMSIKLMEVEGNKVLEDQRDSRTQDFILFDHPVFFIQNVKDYVLFDKELEKAFDKSPDASPNLFEFIFSNFNPLNWRVREILILSALRSKKIGSPLETQYWSATPYALGSHAVKYFVKPSSKISSRTPLKTKDYLRDVMIADLTGERKEVYFDFYVQIQTDPIKMPVEDPTIEWKKTKQYKVATIRIPPQRFDSPEQMKFGENLSFTPWHALLEHRPLGGINRARKEVYLRTSKLRHEKNEALPQEEPTPVTFSPSLLD